MRACGAATPASASLIRYPFLRICTQHYIVMGPATRSSAAPLSWSGRRPHAGITIAFALRGLVLECYHMTGGCGLEGLNVSLAA